MRQRDDGIRVNRSLKIPYDEIQLRFSPSGGPGGQHANRSSTRVELSWNVMTSNALGERQRERIRRHLGHRLDSSGTLRVASSRHRSQLRNREEAIERLRTLVSESLRRRKRRVATTPTQASKESRIREKKRRGEVKKLRRSPTGQ